MAKLWPHPRQASILAAYWPYQVRAWWGLPQQGTRALHLTETSGVLLRLQYPAAGSPALVGLGLEPERPNIQTLASQVLLELYALEDLPQLGHQVLVQVVRYLELWGGRFEQYVQVRLVTSWLNHLVLDVSAGDHRHQVKLSSWGDVQVRNVRADRQTAAATGLPEVEQWRALGGQYVLAVYEHLRRLHVAVGDVASCQQELRQGQPWGEPTHYVRKALPVQEGGVGDE